MVSVRIADPNRAVSDGDGGEKGFYVHGTVPKSPVAPGAELMAYGPFSSGVGFASNCICEIFKCMCVHEIAIKNILRLRISNIYISLCKTFQ